MNVKLFAVNELFSLRNQINCREIRIKGKEIPNPVFEFEEAGFPRSLILALSKSGFETPTTIQSQSWPITLSGKQFFFNVNKII
jgi:superfamily II DNA/RNA helicase